MLDRVIRATTALAVIGVAAVAAVISYRHAYELVRSHGESGTTARLVPLTVDGLIWAASMVVLDANRRTKAVPPLALWSRHHGDDWRQPGARHGTRANRCSGQRLARPGARRLLRAAHDAHQERAEH